MNYDEHPVRTRNMKPKMDPLTVEDYRLLPDAGPRYQLIEGDLHLAPAPNRYHQDIPGMKIKRATVFKR